jgi:hypothetical protein
MFEGGCQVKRFKSKVMNSNLIICKHYEFLLFAALVWKDCSGAQCSREWTARLALVLECTAEKRARRTVYGHGTNGKAVHLFDSCKFCSPTPNFYDSLRNVQYEMSQSPSTDW